MKKLSIQQQQLSTVKNIVVVKIQSLEVAILQKKSDISELENEMLRLQSCLNDISLALNILEVTPEFDYPQWLSNQSKNRTKYNQVSSSINSLIEKLKVELSYLNNLESMMAIANKRLEKLQEVVDGL